MCVVVSVCVCVWCGVWEGTCEDTRSHTHAHAHSHSHVHSCTDRCSLLLTYDGINKQPMGRSRHNRPSFWDIPALRWPTSQFTVRPCDKNKTKTHMYLESDSKVPPASFSTFHFATSPVHAARSQTHRPLTCTSAIWHVSSRSP